MDSRFDWIKTPGTSRLMGVLNEIGEARFVGGCVRDSLLGVPPGHAGRTDIDIATTTEPGVVMKALEKARIRVIPTGIEHGTVTAIIDRVPYEITTLRSDVTTDGRRAIVAFTTDWRADALRRDFTINALYLSVDGTVYDDVGGQTDLAAGVVRFIGVAEDRLREDFLRILRFLRFTARFSDQLDETGWAACVACRDGLDRLSKERIWSEISKLFATARAPMVLQAAIADGVLSHVVEQKGHVDHFRRVHAAVDGRVSPGLGVAALWQGLPRRALQAAFKPSNELLDQVASIEMAAGELARSMPVRHVLYRHGRDVTRDAALVQSARTGQPTDAQVAREIEKWPIPALPLSGKDFVAAGLAPGPLVGQAVSQFERDWIAADFPSEPDTISRLMNSVIRRLA
ncbi:CCA tRNA nucleotidyltransferase [Parvularcula sp. LCG005]|uniref:CCA tRNA nucleotidyltransferase n=1 Tax=Parvularcula sp. LCG005 TaxID=3078805 RepID=UPI0029427734|nr:CCA tRNA nucleotidyltransferase [Parvularcula sp. LCG005]WOI52029.1 CCA tRNA nucleotidyltransferase [Parvularcula sp. LCG005]